VTLATGATIPAHELGDEPELSAVRRRVRQPRGHRGCLRVTATRPRRSPMTGPAPREEGAPGPEAVAPDRVFDGAAIPCGTRSSS